jgi:hypothetical protein
VTHEEFSELEEFGRASGEARRFKPEELVACEACRRANAPTRMACIYCGAPLPLTERAAQLRRPVLRKLEEWERGYNVVLLPAAGDLPAEATDEAALLLRLEAARMRELLAERRALPLARASSLAEAELIVGRLGALGFAVEVIPDELLAADEPPQRVRALAFTTDALVGLPSFEAEPRRLAWGAVALLVAGRIMTRRVEVEERKTKLGGASEVVEARELAADEAVLDIYPASDDGSEGAAGWRVMADGFDYSCLGERKGLLARDNFVTLVAELRERAGAAALDEEYARVRHLLAHVWPPAERAESGGIRRERPGRYNREVLTVVSNEAQFTRYSRLCWRLALARGGGAARL